MRFPSVFLVLFLLCGSASQACDRFHLPGRPIARAAGLTQAVATPVKATVAGVVKAKPVRSTLKFLFF